MIDLVAAIRARLTVECCEVDCWCRECDERTGALLTVLELHAAPESSGVPGEIHCGELIDWRVGGCPTVKALADALGITLE